MSDQGPSGPVGAPEAGDALYGAVVGQDRAVAALRAAARRPHHAYLFLGPPGSGKLEAARGFAAALVSDDEGASDSRARRLALSGLHPDVIEVRREGPAITVDMAREVIRLASRVPVEGDRKVVILDEIHLVQPAAAATLLKTFEEPEPSVVFVALADDLVPDLVTIASRCVRVPFGPVPAHLVAARLEAEGVAPAVAEAAAEAAPGNLDRARLLATDTHLVDRRHAWATLPLRLDGTGAAAARAVDELLALIETAAAPLVARHAEELARVEERVQLFGERGAGRKELDERQRRELRRHRTDEVLAGLATLTAAYRDRLSSADGGADAVAAVAAINAVAESMERNPNEILMLQALLLRLAPPG